jgi:hypothetical protein
MDRACGRTGVIWPAGSGKNPVRDGVKNLTGELRARHAETIAWIVLGALAKAELDASTWLQGTFIVADNSLAAVAAVRRVLRTCQNR